MGDIRIPYYEIYKLVPENYSLIKIEDLNLSNRLRNRLLSLNIFNVSDMLRLSEDILRDIPGLGRNCIDEVERYCRELKKENNTINSEKIELTKELFPYIDNIKQGEFTFFSNMNLSASSKKFLEYAKESHLLLEQELIDECLDGTKEAYDIINALEAFVKLISDRKKMDDFTKLYSAERLKVPLKSLVCSYTMDDAKRESLLKTTYDGNVSLREYITISEEKILADDPLVLDFLKWCNFDLQAETKEFFKEFDNDKRMRTVIEMRSAGCTLEQVGTELDVTRERVRQIEKKISTKFIRWQSRKNILSKLFIDAREEIALATYEINEIVGPFGMQLTYFLKINEFDNVTYDKQSDMFILEDNTLVDRIQAYVDNLPDTFSEVKVIAYVEEGKETFGYPEKMIFAAIEENYRKTGGTYHRSRLTLEKLFPEVITRFYPEGMHIYNELELEKFKKIINDEYGIVLTQNNRAISALISRTCMLCGRGIYKGKSKTYISQTLSKKIYDYIEESESPVFLTNTIFSVFEQELLLENIDNKYYLQGILHELFGDKWTFRRDYVAKDDTVTSIYSSVVSYIKKAGYPVKKQELYYAFPGISEIVLNLATSDKDIMNLFGEYVHTSHLKLSDGDVRYLHNVLEKHLQRKEVCHCEEIYEYIKVDNFTLLKNNYVKYQFCMYSLLECLFGEQYNFSRPFVGRLDVKIDRAFDVLAEKVREYDEINISDILIFARECHLQINSILDFINFCNETHLLINSEKLMKIECTGINEELVSYIENIILNEIQDTQPIVHLNCLMNLPKVNVPWSEWLVYSVLNKWSENLEVAPSFNQFRYSTPLVAPRGNFSKSITEDINLDRIGSLVVADDLSDIDTLIEDYVFEDINLEDL